MAIVSKQGKTQKMTETKHKRKIEPDEYTEKIDSVRHQSNEELFVSFVRYDLVLTSIKLARVCNKQTRGRIKTHTQKKRSNRGLTISYGIIRERKLVDCQSLLCSFLICVTRIDLMYQPVFQCKTKRKTNRPPWPLAHVTQ